ncbi:hypothetical protein, partial [Azospirillum sp. B4]|uniref:COG4315 family predicted lipoprotein n=1 Tax=Azospirillum sp. B4 TaxID=95605 RepID=UPI0005C9636D
MLKQIIAAAALTAGLAVATGALAQAKVADTAKGKALVDGRGMTLYTFDHDTEGQSNCIAQCAANWPAFKAGAEAKASGDWTLITRDDGAKQWAYKGKPLYAFAK